MKKRKLLVCIAACLLAMLAVGCKNGKDESVTTAGESSSVTVVETEAGEETEPEEVTEPETETVTEEETDGNAKAGGCGDRSDLY